MRSCFLNPLPGYVENKVKGSKVLGPYDKLIAGYVAAGRDLPPVRQNRFVRRPQNQRVAYDNEFTISWRLGFERKQWP